MFLLAMHRLSEYYSEPSIFKNALYGFLMNIIGVAVVFAVIFVALFAAIFSSAAHPATAVSPFGFIIGFLGVVAAVFVIVIVSAVLYRRAFNKLGEKSGVDSFNTAGTLYLVGAVLTIVFVGALIVWIAWIFAASGYYSLKPKTAEPSTISYYQPQAPATVSLAQNKYCPYCGTENAPDAVYCRSCGRQIGANQ
jgi:uncharacterized membrane protein/ribosomal protein L40E